MGKGGRWIGVKATFPHLLLPRNFQLNNSLICICVDLYFYSILHVGPTGNWPNETLSLVDWDSRRWVCTTLKLPGEILEIAQ